MQLHYMLCETAMRRAPLQKIGNIFVILRMNNSTNLISG